VPGFRTINEAILAATLRPTGPLRPTGLSGVCSTKGLMADDSLASCGAAAGCLNPLTLVKLLIGLLLVVLLPFYMLPLLVVRIATLGRSSIRYNSVITVTSGEQARWGHGALDPVPVRSVCRRVPPPLRPPTPRSTRSSS